MKKLSESVWGDLRKKSLGQEERTEDYINDMNLDQFYDYLQDTYRCINSPSDIRINMFDNTRTICMCLYEDEVGYYRYIYYDGYGIDTQDDVPSTIGCLKEMEEIYTIKPRVEGSINIYPKDEFKVTNKFFIEVLDFLLERIDTPLEQQIVKKEDCQRP